MDSGQFDGNSVFSGRGSVPSQAPDPFKGFRKLSTQMKRRHMTNYTIGTPSNGHRVVPPNQARDLTNGFSVWLISYLISSLLTYFLFFSSLVNITVGQKTPKYMTFLEKLLQC
ncbi:hypothetical protein O6P43_002850 [Quillaja saponaria]|uniref:Uncharacterized protein n=1 Tax=Quillaja saponaria TaxID=32244 RepID=A0AAD7QDD0_QUISA|nr:hypothetical protein O6P43_002850 [Quillaja saponaria]